MQLERNIWGRRYPALAGVLSFFLLLSSFLAVDRSAHHWVHDEADHAEHQCLAAILGQTAVDSTSAAGLLFISPPLLSCLSVFDQVPVFSGSDYRLLPGRAPPAAS